MRSNRSSRSSFLTIVGFLLLLFYGMFLTLMTSVSGAATEKLTIALIISARDTVVAARTLRDISQLDVVKKKCLVEFYTDREVSRGLVSKEDINETDIILADFMKREFDDFLSASLDDKNAKVYSLRCGYLATGLKKVGIVPDLRCENYYQPVTVDNLKNLIFMVLSHNGVKIPFDPPFVLPDAGIFHPDADHLFSNFHAYSEWYRQEKKHRADAFWVGIHTFRTSAVKENGKLEADIIKALEKQGLNVLPVFGKPPYHKSLNAFFLDENENPRVQSIVGFALRFLRGFPEETTSILNRINAPIFIPLEAHGVTLDQWKRSEIGISTRRTAWQVCIPEQNGGIEPTLVGGKSAVRLKGMADVLYDRIAAPTQINFLINRIKAWLRLKQTPNDQKRVALLYWNHPPGKQNIGGSYMNCFESIASIVGELDRQGYTIDSEKLDKESIQKRILLSGRNVGSWAPGELEKLAASQGIITIPVSQYKTWFEALPKGFQDQVIDQWGAPEDSDIMIRNGGIIIPCVNLGNLMLMPQPARGFGEDPEKLYHDPKLFPHHQYIAFYLWLKKEFKADAVISLGKHGTHEWLPGKQIGLSITDPPDVLLQDIPNIYPYIVDNVGEGIQAKRRGRGVIIDHLIPPLKKGGSYMEYRKLTALIDGYHEAEKTDPSLADEKFKRTKALILKLGLHKELGMEDVVRDDVETVEHYILELQETLIPYGLHRFGISPEGEPLDALTGAIGDASPEIDFDEIKSRLTQCGDRELASLINALNGGYISSAEGNDPVRNPDAVPTGKNFYGFNIDKVPSKDAWAMGKKLSDEMIDGYRKKHGTYPDKLGIILWSTELQRNEGASVAAVFHLLGISPVWDKKEQVVDLLPIPGTLLGRPRIDVLVQSSGLFRDSYAKLIKLMDRAVTMAGALTDVENFIAVNNGKIEKGLLETGYSKKDAAALSKARIFAPMPGAYSHALQDLIPNSGTWEKESEISDVFIHHYSFAYGNNIWGKSLKSGYKSNLADVKLTMHTLSSNLYNMLDNDDMFAFLGGLSMAVKSLTGSYPETVVANMQGGQEVQLEDLPKAIGKALRTRYFNPKWIDGMMTEGYSGAKAMDEFVENMWGFQVTSPYAVTGNQWEEVHDVYIKDKYDKGLKSFFDKHNPWVIQSISGRLLEADRKQYWTPEDKTKKSLARAFAMNVIEKGVACCEHTCNNPMFQSYVTNFLSISGLLTPKQMESFKMILAKASGKSLDEQKKAYENMREGLARTIEEIQENESPSENLTEKNLEGFEMVEEKVEETEIASSGSAWQVMAIVAVILVLLYTGFRKIKV